MKVARLFLAGLMVLCRFSSVGEAKTVDLGTSGEWSIYAYFDNSTNMFGHCGMTTGSKVGSESLTLIVSKAGYNIFLDSQDWDLPVGETFDSVSTIGSDTWTGHALVIYPHGIAMTYPFESEFGVAFRQGSELDLQIGKFSRSLKLDGAQTATSALANCLDQYMPSKNPFGPQSTPVSNPFK